MSNEKIYIFSSISVEKCLKRPFCDAFEGGIDFMAVNFHNFPHI